MAHISDWMARLRTRISSAPREANGGDAESVSFGEWESVQHRQASVIRLLGRAAEAPDSAVFCFDFSTVGTTTQRGENDEGRGRHDAAGSILASAIGAQDVALQYDDQSFVVFLESAGDDRGRTVCRNLWARLVSELQIDPASGQAPRLYEIRVRRAPVPASAAYELPALSFVPLPADGSEPEIEAAPAATDRLDFIYRPLMEVVSNVVSMFICIPTRHVGEGHFSYGYGTLDTQNDTPSIRSLDLRVLGSVASVLRRLGTKGGQAGQVVVPVHDVTLNNPISRISYAYACSQWLSGLADNVTFEIIGLPDNVSTDDLVNAVAPLQMAGSAVFARVPLERADFRNYAYCGISAVGVDAYPLDQECEELAIRLDGFVERAGGLALKTYVHGIRSLSLSTFVSCSGFDWVGGHALTNAIKAPRGAYLYKLLYKYIAMA